MHRLGAGLRASTPRGPCLTTASSHAEVEQGVGGALRVGLADGDLALLAVADGDGDVRECRAHLLGRRGARAAQNIGR